jgi:hypothetical protein
VRRKTDLSAGVYDLMTPYRAEGWASIVEQCALLDQFGIVPHLIQYGFSLGDLPPLTRTETPQNSKSALEHPEVIDAWVQEEIDLGRLEGPYSIGEMERCLDGPFRTSPLGVVEKAGSSNPAKKRVVWNSSHKGVSGLSINEQLDSDQFPTDWGTAALVESLVSHFFWYTM